MRSQAGRFAPLAESLHELRVSKSGRIGRLWDRSQPIRGAGGLKCLVNLPECAGLTRTDGGTGPLRLAGGRKEHGVSGNEVAECRNENEMRPLMGSDRPNEVGASPDGDAMCSNES